MSDEKLPDLEKAIAILQVELAHLAKKIEHAEGDVKDVKEKTLEQSRVELAFAKGSQSTVQFALTTVIRIAIFVGLIVPAGLALYGYKTLKDAEEQAVALAKHAAEKAAKETVDTELKKQVSEVLDKSEMTQAINEAKTIRQLYSEIGSYAQKSKNLGGEIDEILARVKKTDFEVRLATIEKNIMKVERLKILLTDAGQDIEKLGHNASNYFREYNNSESRDFKNTYIWYTQPKLSENKGTGRFIPFQRDPEKPQQDMASQKSRQFGSEVLATVVVPVENAEIYAKHGIANVSHILEARGDLKSNHVALMTAINYPIVDLEKRPSYFVVEVFVYFK